MNKTILGAPLLLALLINTGCGESQQQQSATPPPPASPAPATPASPAGQAPEQQSETASQQSTMEVRQSESAAPPPPPAAMPATAPSTTPSTAAPAPAPQPAAAPAKGTLLKASELKEQPFIDAKTVANLPAQTAVTILERNGGWFRVKSAAQSGWLRMLNVKVTEGAQNLGSGTDLTQAATLATGRAGSGNIVSTSGLRGLSEEELRSAQPDYAQFDQLNGYGADKAAANGYAKANGLTSRSVSYLPAPK